MSEDFTLAPLGKVLTKSEEWIDIKPDERYREVTVRLWGKGVFQRREVMGAEIAGSRRLIVRSGQFILSRIDARNGAFGLVPDSLNGAVVSNDFPVFTPNHSCIIPAFLAWMSKTRSFVDICKAASEGTTNRVRLQEERFLTTKIPLPPLSEQRRIVARIEQLAAKIEEARSLRWKAEQEAMVLSSAVSRYFFGPDGTKAPTGRLETFATRVTKGESPEWQGFTYQDSGPIFVRSENVLWGALDLSKRTCIPREFHQKLNRSQLQPGDVLINLVGASIGRSCVVPTDIGEANVNQAVAVISPDPKQLDSKYLMHFLISAPVQDIIHGGKVETARPNISLGDLRNIVLRLPSLDEQRRVVAYLDDLQVKVGALKHLQAETAAELDAMLPSILDRAFKGEL